MSDTQALVSTKETVVPRQKGKFARQNDALHRGVNGRPSTYRKRYAAAAGLLAKNGATDATIAEFFGISSSTLATWKARYPGFASAIHGGTEALTPVVERSLALRAIGPVLENEKVFYDSQRGEVIRVPVREQLPPDARAAERWLAVKGGKEWSQPQQVDHRVVVRSLTDEELARAVLDAQQLLALAGPNPSDE